jgi:hypothetical protein
MKRAEDQVEDVALLYEHPLPRQWTASAALLHRKALGAAGLVDGGLRSHDGAGMQAPGELPGSEACLRPRFHDASASREIAEQPAEDAAIPISGEPEPNGL